MSPDFDAGSMRHRVTWQRLTGSLDSMNQPAEVWSDLGTFWASVEPLSSREIWNARQIHSTSTHKIILRGGPAITSADRLAFGTTGRTFSIDGINRVDERNAYLELTTTERKPPQI